ncbi:PAS domain S-box protein [Robertkochia aurantiaca]|uniref:PAS domain S-box protein n=1 Tax=Robertkochia aurantiaca TaxID=2873700 RepID=UPI001CCEF854|nr:PAS domain S-box protein [Robertkochia sp. 3YJGBD-33]
MPQNLIDSDQRLRDLIQHDVQLLHWLLARRSDGFWFFEAGNPASFFTDERFWKSVNLAVPEAAAQWERSMELLSPDARNRFRTLITDIQAKSDFSETLILQPNNGEKHPFAIDTYLVRNHKVLLIRFNKVPERENSDLLSSLSKQNELYRITNKVSKVGGWEVRFDEPSITWTSVTKEIHEVPDDYEPDLETAISFYKEGWSRESIQKAVKEAVENRIPYDKELKLITAKGREIWVRAVGTPEFDNGKCIRIFGTFQDIGEDKRKENERLLTKERFEVLFNKSFMGMVLVDTNQKLIRYNRASVDIMGLENMSHEEIMGITFKDLVHPEDLPTAQTYRRKLLNREFDSYNLECRFVKKTGETIWCQVHTSLIHSPNLNESFILTTYEDITARKNLEEKASTYARRFKAAFEHSPIGVALVSLKGQWLMVNNALGNIIGYTKDELLEMSISELTHPADRQNDLHLIQQLTSARKESYSVQKRFIHKNGNIVHGLIHVSLIRNEQGDPLYYMGQINDITRRVVTEKALTDSLGELQCLLNATTHVSIIETDLNGVIRKFNKGAQNLLGYKPEDVIGIHQPVCFHDNKEIKMRSEELTDYYGREIKGFEVFIHKARKDEFESREWTYIKKNGERFPVQLVVTAIHDYTGQITGYLGVATDISRLKKMEASLLLEKAKAERASRSKSEFLANMSHEIRTPLNAIVGFSELMKQTELSTTQSQYIQTVCTSADHLQDIINDVLDFSKIEAGKVELESEDTNLYSLCLSTIDMIQYKAEEKGLKLKFDYDQSLPYLVKTDKVRLRQVLINLLGNAIKFTHKGHVHLKVSMPTNSEKDSSVVLFSIADTGIGIESKNIQKIFKAFDQEDSSTTRKYGGTGLGLTISNSILNLMGSQIHVESEPGRGSTFYFEVPFEASEKTGQPETISVLPRRILLVGEKHLLPKVTLENLAAQKVQISTARNSIEAIDLLNGPLSFDLLISELTLPYTSAGNLIGYIRNHMKIPSSQLPVIVLFDPDKEVNQERIKKACHDADLIPKPITVFSIADCWERLQKSAAATLVLTKESKAFSWIENPRVLIAEDNPVNLLLVRTLLEKYIPQVQILTAYNGEEALEIFKTHKVDLILMDLQMPGMGGKEATRHIRSFEPEGRETPIVALTARALKGERDRCLSNGMNEYLTKPIVQQELLHMLKRFLTLKKTDLHVF